MKVQTFGSARFKEICTGTLLPLLLAGCGGVGGVGSNQQAVISDQLHGGGAAGFLWMPPMVSTVPVKFGVFESGVPVTVRIDEVSKGVTVRSLATFTSKSGPEGQRLREHKAHNDKDCDDDDKGDRNDAYYIANWETEDDHLTISGSYRVRALVPAAGGGTREIGFADLQVARDKKAFLGIDTNNFVPLLANGVLHIKFRVEQAAVDADADGVFDWVDNCPNTSNANQLDSLKNGVGDACRCDKVVCTALDACHSKGVCQSTSGVCTNPVLVNGTACPVANAAAACLAGTCTLTACNAGHADCDKSLVNGCETATDTTSNCGACGVICAGGANAGAVCAAGKCGLSCGTGYANCDGNAANGCELPVSADPANCGGCNIACANGEGCVSGGCTTAVCQATFADCDHDASNGCEVSPASDVANCGGCGNVCSYANAGAVCSSGACALGACTAGYNNCDHDATTGCESNSAVDVNNCGACGKVCSFANGVAACTAGACALAACQTNYADCNANAVDGCEVSLQNDVLHCGSCGNACQLPNATANCALGACGIANCNPGYADCDGLPGNGCEVNLNDVKNCGACNNACGAVANGAPSCATGTCVVSCSAGYKDCDGSYGNGCEVDVTTASNCGSCGTACIDHETCQSGACSTAVCDKGFSDCNGLPSDGCETTLATDVKNCNVCGNACSFANAAAQCVSGACGFAVCDQGYADCDGAQANGCETGLMNDAANCGGCHNVCNLANATSVCNTGLCAIGACAAGYADCNGDPSDGCEVNLTTDVTNCGVCKTVCAAVPSATAACTGSCGFVCAAGYADCNGDRGDGCEVDVTGDVGHCGGCNNVCGKNEGCVAGGCTTSVCQAGYADCNHDASDGCESAQGTDVNNCGACGHACLFAHAAASCGAGTCAMGACDPGYANCDGNPSNGCETNLVTDVAHCGSCGLSCSAANGVAACAGSACVVASCNLGFSDCDLNAVNGCEVSTVGDVNNCGACKAACPSVASAAPTCSASACGFACVAGQADCNLTPADGCEVNTNVDSANCGGCGVVCKQGRSCQAGVCSSAVCASGYADCDKDPSNGCEVVLATDVNHCGVCTTSCSYANGNGACALSTCSLLSCNAGYKDCNSLSVDGCEANLNTNVSNCGACGNVCRAHSACTAAQCTCLPGYLLWNNVCIVDGPANFSDDFNRANGPLGGTYLTYYLGLNMAYISNNLACGVDNNAVMVPVKQMTTDMTVAFDFTGSSVYMQTLAVAADQSSDNASRIVAGITQADSAFQFLVADQSNGGGNQFHSPQLFNLTLNKLYHLVIRYSPNADVRLWLFDGPTLIANYSVTYNHPVVFNEAGFITGRGGEVCNDNLSVLVNSGIAACNVGFDDCDGNPTNGCETSLLTDATHCGVCTTACSYANAGASCSNGTCAIGKCDASYANCDGNPVNGCEANTSSVSSCGGCGNVCGSQNASAACSSNVCVETCSAGYANCDKQAGNGCEISLQTDPNNCGACGRTCRSGSCIAGACTTTMPLWLTSLARSNCQSPTSTGVALRQQGSLTVTAPPGGATSGNYTISYSTVGGSANHAYAPAISCVTFLGPNYRTDGSGNGGGSYVFGGTAGTSRGYDTQALDGGNNLINYTSAATDYFPLP